MSISTLRKEVSLRTHAFAWDQWSQMGISGHPGRLEHRAADPEALLLFTLEVGRDEPRLFEEVLDWLWLNQRLVSVQRLRNLVRDADDHALVEAAVGWLAGRRPRARLTANAGGRTSEAVPLFRHARTPVRSPDPAFLTQGFLKPETEPRGAAQSPDPRRPINFAFRLRHLLGLGARAEVVRVLVGTDAPWMTVQAIARAAGYAKRNVHEALVALASAGAVDVVVVANEQRYRAPRERWSSFLEWGLDDLPQHREWPALLGALRRIVRWLADPRTAELSDYLLASEARVLIDGVAPDLRFAGVPVSDRGLTGAEYWDDAVATIRTALDALE
jgi:hypothetical protein